MVANNGDYLGETDNAFQVTASTGRGDSSSAWGQGFLNILETGTKIAGNVMSIINPAPKQVTTPVKVKPDPQPGDWQKWLPWIIGGVLLLGGGLWFFTRKRG